jgi:hypothetical protein
MAVVSIANSQMVAGTHAAPALEDLSGGGTLTHNGNAYTLDLGVVALGATLPPIELAVVNNVSGPADSLSGNFAISNGSGFDTSSFAPFVSPAAAQSKAGRPKPCRLGVLPGRRRRSRAIAASVLAFCQLL